MHCHRWATPTHRDGKERIVVVCDLIGPSLSSQLGGGVIPGPTNIGTLLAKRATVIGTTLRSRSPEYKHQLTKEVMDEVT